MEALSYFFLRVCEAIGDCVLLPKYFQKTTFVASYATALAGGICWGISNDEGSVTYLKIFMHALVFVFLGMHMYIASKRLSIVSFKLNAVLAEAYNVFVLFSCLGSSLKSGIVLIFAGAIIILSLYFLRKSFVDIQMKVGSKRADANIDTTDYV